LFTIQRRPAAAKADNLTEFALSGRLLTAKCGELDSDQSFAGPKAPIFMVEGVKE